MGGGTSINLIRLVLKEKKLSKEEKKKKLGPRVKETKGGVRYTWGWLFLMAPPVLASCILLRLFSRSLDDCVVPVSF